MCFFSNNTQKYTIWCNLLHTLSYSDIDMSAVFACRLNVAERELLERKVQSNVRRVDGCDIWEGATNRDGYGIFRVKFRGRRVTLTVHRVSYFLSVEHFLSPKMHVSHVCHRKKCVKISHLSYEPQSVNNSRSPCFSNARCKGHRGYPNCVF